MRTEDIFNQCSTSIPPETGGFLMLREAEYRSKIGLRLLHICDEAFLNKIVNDF